MREREAGVWELRVFVGRDPLNGKKIYTSRTIRGTKRAADKVKRSGFGAWCF